MGLLSWQVGVDETYEEESKGGRFKRFSFNAKSYIGKVHTFFSQKQDQNLRSYHEARYCMVWAAITKATELDRRLNSCAVMIAYLSYLTSNYVSSSKRELQIFDGKSESRGWLLVGLFPSVDYSNLLYEQQIDSIIHESLK